MDYLATEIPNLELDIFVVDLFDVAADGWLSDDHLAQMTVHSAARKKRTRTKVTV